MKHLGDITLIKGNEAPVVDCVIGGSPCQDLSVAGLRKGLAGARSGLYMEQIRIIKEMRENDRANGRSGVDVRPRYMVWENVPGAFSTNGGKDFAAVLEEAIRVAEPEAPNVDVPEKGWPTSGCLFDEMGKWSVAWRILDAQFWGVPQRRRRIALVADFGGLSAPEILFVRKGVSGDIEPGQPKGKEAPGDAGAGSGGAGICGFTNRGFQSGGVSETLRACSHGAIPMVSYAGPTVISVDQGGGKSGAHSYDGVAPTLTCTHGGEPAVVYGIDQQGGKGGANYSVNVSPPMMSDSHGTPHAVAYTYDARGNGDGHTVSTITGDHQNRITDYTSVVMEPRGFEMQAFGMYKDSGIASALKARDYKDATDLIVDSPIAIDRAFFNQGQNALYEPQVYDDGTVSTLVSRGPSAVVMRHIVRRLTPLECERLQGYPDGWTDIGEWVDSKGKKHKEADSPRYKALGNSIALPPWKWVLKRLCACYERDATMASLFDGIGGFPYIWEQLNGKGSCLWASEIEEFPMAVTKARFGE